MPLETVCGATCQCTLGTQTSLFFVPAERAVFVGNQPAGTIQDHEPSINISPFGLCKRSGDLVSCTPSTPNPWSPGKESVLIAQFPALSNDSTLACTYGGTIKIVEAGQDQVTLS